MTSKKRERLEEALTGIQVLNQREDAVHDSPGHQEGARESGRRRCRRD